jgi:AhpD family alkylhydroperoxidase
MRDNEVFALNYKTKMLIAVGAAVTANCQPCLESAVTVARNSGLEEKEILEAIGVARMVRRGAIGNMDEFASALTGNADENAETPSHGCGCH